MTPESIVFPTPVGGVAAAFSPTEVAISGAPLLFTTDVASHGVLEDGGEQPPEVRRKGLRDPKQMLGE
jgi:hypothetical protein